MIHVSAEKLPAGFSLPNAFWITKQSRWKPETGWIMGNQTRIFLVYSLRRQYEFGHLNFLAEMWMRRLLMFVMSCLEKIIISLAISDDMHKKAEFQSNEFFMSLESQFILHMICNLSFVRCIPYECHFSVVLSRVFNYFRLFGWAIGTLR